MHWKNSARKPREEGSRREAKVALDWMKLEGASKITLHETTQFLNVVTGDVIRVFEGGENADVQLKQIEVKSGLSSTSSRFLSRAVSLGWKSSSKLSRSQLLKDKLNIAIDGKGDVSQI